MEKKKNSSWLSPYNITLSLLALALGLAIGWLDLQVTEVLITIIALLTGGLILGTLRPAAAWRWALLMAIGLPIMEAIALATGMKTEEPVHIDILVLLVALVFALVGTYIGVLTRTIVRSLLSRQN